ncbi:MAG TPA: flagellar biosynthetic protein FliQ [Lachnospiraceae bacterium]|nr:flagellar biosynthetic protein FliQ [Lachnospiraceae bacterium]
MTQGEVLDIASQAIYTIIVVSAPLLLVSLIIGLIISIFQTVTSIQEQTLTFVPKILAVFVGMMIFGSWILTQLTEYITDLWSNFGVFLS